MDATIQDLQLDKNFWNERWKNGETGWNIGYASPAIAQFISQYKNKEAAILIPGCGNGYEAEFIIANGFTNVTLIDIAPEAVERLKLKFEGNPHINIYCEDFFKHEGAFDLIIEQTFFCALHPSQRADYVAKTASLLKPKGKIIGVLFNKIFEKPGPPFGGTTAEYRPLFEPHFNIAIMEECYNSIPPRAGAEVFIKLEKKDIENNEK